MNWKQQDIFLRSILLASLVATGFFYWLKFVQPEERSPIALALAVAFVSAASYNFGAQKQHQLQKRRKL
jgi:hypothetical protein